MRTATTNSRPADEVGALIVQPSTGESAAASARRNPTSVGLLIALHALVVYLASPVRFESDSYWTTFTARSLIAHGDVDLDEYADLARSRHDFQIDRQRGHVYYAVPLATSLVALPMVAVAAAINGASVDRQLHAGDNPTEPLSAALIVALTTFVMFLVARRVDRKSVV